MLDTIKNPFLQKYLEYVEYTETPRIMHIWSAITSIGATVGRKVYLPFGIKNIYPNMYVLLVGPPGSRKTTGMEILQDLLVQSTSIRFAPDDTSGQRQGLIVAMEDLQDTANEDDLAQLNAAISAMDIGVLNEMSANINVTNKHCMFAMADEFSSFIGTNAMELCTFLNKMYDGKNFNYKVRSVQNTLTNPLLSILGGTTSKNLADNLPPATIGHGFSSRIIFVYANKKYRNIPRPKKLNKNLGKELIDQLKHMTTFLEGPLIEDKHAGALIDHLYGVEVKLNDPRFIYYIDRRQSHMLKTAMSLAIGRHSMTLTEDDVQQAHELLTYTEQFMPEALGEFGLTKVAASKQKMVEFLQHAKGPVPEDILWAVMQRDLMRIEFLNALTDLENTGKLIKLTSSQGPAWMYNERQLVELEKSLNSLVDESVQQTRPVSNVEELKRG